MNILSRWRLLPAPGHVYTQAAWGWTFSILVLELVLANIARIATSAISENAPQGWIGPVCGMTAAVAFAQMAEHSRPGALTDSIKLQLSLRTAVIASALSIGGMYMMSWADQTRAPLPILWAGGIFLAGCILMTGLHYFGLRSGVRMRHIGRATL